MRPVLKTGGGGSGAPSREFWGRGDLRIGAGGGVVFSASHCRNRETAIQSSQLLDGLTRSPRLVVRDRRKSLTSILAFSSSISSTLSSISSITGSAIWPRS